MIRAGTLNHTLVLQRRTETVTPAGAVAEIWTDFATIRAERVSSAANLADQPYGEAGKAKLQFRIRHFHGLSTADRVIYRGQPFAIVEIGEFGRRLMELTCEVPK